MEEQPKEESGKKRKRRSRRRKDKVYNFSDTPEWMVVANKALFIAIFLFGVIIPWALHYYLVNHYYR